MAIEDENNYGLSGAQVKELAAQIKKRAVSVDEDGASHVEEADQIYTQTLQLQEAAFIHRTTAGNLSIETGEANLLKLYGKTVQEGHVDEVKDFSYEFADSETTATIDWDALPAEFDRESGTVTMERISGTFPWSVRGSWGWMITAYNVNGITVNGQTAVGDTIIIHWVKGIIGTLTTAKPTSFVSTGYNQYNATAGYAHVVGGQEYRIDGTYTSLGFTEEIGGTTTAVTVTNSKFTPESDGYVYVTGGSGDILIALVWSGTRDSDPYVAYSADTISIPTIDKDSASLPTASYGMPSVGDVADEIDFEEQLYIQRIGHYAYSVENLETVEALGVDYWYDENDIFYVLADPVMRHLATSVKSVYTANDFGTEEIVGTSVAMPVMISYGNNLVDKLRNLLPIQSIGDKLEMNGTTLNVAQSALDNIGGVRRLTANDRNWPTNNPQGVAHWLLPEGVYSCDNNVEIYPDSGATPRTWPLFIKFRSGDYSYAIYYDVGASRWMYWSAYATRGSRGAYGAITPEVVDSLTSTSTGRALSANMGKTLNDKITPSTGSGAPTTSTVGIVGKIYIDTDTDNAYMCTKVSSGTYTWKQITA